MTANSDVAPAGRVLQMMSAAGQACGTRLVPEQERVHEQMDVGARHDATAFHNTVELSIKGRAPATGDIPISR